MSIQYGPSASATGALVANGVVEDGEGADVARSLVAVGVTVQPQASGVVQGGSDGAADREPVITCRQGRSAQAQPENRSALAGGGGEAIVRFQPVHDVVGVVEHTVDRAPQFVAGRRVGVHRQQLFAEIQDDLRDEEVAATARVDQHGRGRHSCGGRSSSLEPRNS